jgi:hypothetical protein
VIGICSTLWRAVAHALETNIDHLQPIGRPIGRQDVTESAGGIDRFVYRAMIAWLHYIQPWARLRGQVKGSLGKSNLTQEGIRLIETAPRLSLKETIKLLFSRFEASYWDIHYTSLDRFLQSLCAAGETTFNTVRCDEGWQQRYDLRIDAGPLCSFDIKVTAEDHGGMNRLFRVSFRVHRPWPLIVAVISAAGIVGHSLQAHFVIWLSLFVCIASVFMLFEAGKRGGQLLAVVNAVSGSLKLYTCAPERGDKRDDVEPVFEEQ